MKLKLATILAVLLLVLAAVPTVAAPKITVEGGLWYGWIQGAFDDAGQVWIGADDSYHQVDFVYPGGVIPYLYASLDLAPNLRLGYNGWFAYQLGANEPMFLTDDDDYVMWGGDDWYYGGDDYILHATGRVMWSTSRLGVEVGPLGVDAANITLLGGLQGTVVAQEATVAVYDDLDDIDYLTTTGTSCMVGPYVGLAGQYKLGAGFTLYGNLTGALMFGGHSEEGQFGEDEDDLYSADYAYFDSGTGLFPAVEGTIGVKYDITDSLFAGLAVHGAALFGVTKPANFDSENDVFIPGEMGALNMAGLQLTLGYKF